MSIVVRDNVLHLYESLHNHIPTIDCADNRIRGLLYIFAFTTLFTYISYAVGARSLGPKIPIAGQGSIFIPGWWARLRFIRNSREIIQDGYEKYLDLFIVRKSGVDIVVIGSPKFLDEIRAQTKDSARSVEPFLHDFVGSYTGGKVFATSDLQNRVLAQKVTPHLGSLIPLIEDEIKFAMSKELPLSDTADWVEVDPVKAFPRIAARVVARIFLGEKGARDEKWLDTTAKYTLNVFITGFVLRFVPKIFRPFIAALLPTYRNLFTNLATARSIIGGLASERIIKPQEDVLQWIMNFANSEELALGNLAERMMVLSLSGIHTTALTMVQAMYDMCARPDDFSTIRTELAESLSAEGQWSMGSVANLHKLDSLLKESQRLSPVFLLTYNRILPCAVTLSNGVQLEAGTRVAVPQNAILNDPSRIPGGNPSAYNPWRYAKLRQDPKNARQYQFAMVDSSNMAFGYGRYACPGRFFVALEIKLILAHLLMSYDWMLPEGCDRPKNFTIDSDMYPDPTARLLMRRRKMADSD